MVLDEPAMMGEPNAEVNKMAEETEGRQPSANKNGKKAEGGSGSTFFTWFMVLALLGVWTSVAVVWFELVDYDDVLARAKEFRYNISEVLQGKLGAYDADGDGDFDVEDARVLLGLTKDGSSESSDSLQEVLGILAEEGSDWFYGFLAFLYDVITPFEKAEEDDEDGAGTSQSEGVQDEKPGEGTFKKDKPKEHPTRNIGRKLKEALKEQLRMIHEKIEAKKIARMALAEVRAIVAKEEAEKAAFQEEELRREAAAQRARERAETKLQEEEEREGKRERIEKEQVKKEKAERERAAKEREEKERVAKEKAEKEREEKEKEERKAKQDKEEKAEKKPPSKKPEKTEVPEDDGRKADKDGKASSKKDEKISTKDLLKAASKKTSKESDKGGKK